MHMKKILRALPLLLAGTVVSAEATVNVVTTLPDYASIARQIGADRVDVQSIIPGRADPHFLKPKPSYALMLREADLFVSTGLDLELWAPVVVNKSGNKRIVDGEPGYVAVSNGVELLQKPASLDRSAGDVHIYGNPHIHTSPINVLTIAHNITIGLCKVDGEGCDTYRDNLAELSERLTCRLYGEELIEVIGTDTLNTLAGRGRLVRFLEERGQLDLLGGWLKRALPLRGRRIICYHKNWAYFVKLFGLEVVEYIEPKPGIPPTARHVAELIERIEDDDIPVLMAANYFERKKPELIADRTGIVPVVVPLSVGGEPGIDGYCGLVDLWIERLLAAFEKADAR